VLRVRAGHPPRKGTAMELVEWIEGNPLVVKVLAARLDAASAPEMKRCLAKLISKGHQRLVLDISDVEFIDSNGLGILVFARKRLGKYGEMAISGPRNAVMSMLKLTRLYQVFDIFSDHQQAIVALRTSTANTAAFDDSLTGRQ
jgi:anti-sigma B factor antagonist